jgi:hypothetical protein
MSLKFVGDLIVRLDSFRNIDLHRKGFYYYELSLFHEQDDETVYSSPYNYYVHGPEQPKHINGSPGMIHDQVFKSKTFFVRYCDDDVDLDEIIVFRFELRAELLNYPSLMVKVRLMMCEPSDILDSSTEFKEETSGLVHINFYSQGLHQFVPVTFDRLHMCVLNSTVHVIPLDFKFRPEGSSFLKDSRPEFKLVELLSKCMFQGKVLNEETKRFAVDSYLKSAWNSVHKINSFLQQWKGNVLPVKGIEEISDELPEDIASAIMQQVQYYAAILNSAELELIQILQKNGSKIARSLMHSYNSLVRDRWGESIFSTFTQNKQFMTTCEDELGPSHHRIAKKIRKSEYYKTVSPLPVTVTSLFPRPKVHPIIFVDVSSKLEGRKSDFEVTWLNYLPHNTDYHLIVFVHGFQANSLDLRCISNQVSLIKSNTMLLCSTRNELKTDGDIEKMGKRLAREVFEYLDDWENSVVPSKISFIGHSLGGLIIRAALPLLERISDKLNFYMTFSTPHLGYIYNSSALVDAGMWFIKKFKKSLAMKQLTMTDSSNLKETLIYCLSQRRGLEWFKHLAFVSSYQDEYAPFESARVQVGLSAETSKKGGIMKEMAENLLSQVTADEIFRIDVDYKIEKAVFDKLIGRAAHIEMLENESMIRMILYCCARFFE